MTSTPEGASGKPFGSSRDERVRGRTWTVEAAEAGQRLDKFLAAADRAGSRSRATDALARGRVFVDEAEMAPADGARAVAAGEVVRLWMDRPGSAARGAAPASRVAICSVTPAAGPGGGLMGAPPRLGLSAPVRRSAP